MAWAPGAAVIGLLLATRRLGGAEPMATGLPIVLFALAGATWWVVHAVYRRAWALAAALASAVFAAGLIACVALPGAAMMRQSGEALSVAAADVGKLDEVIHGRLRLGIVTYLASAEVADFNELKAALQATQGNLSVHLRKLEEAGDVAIEKGYLGRRPLTRVRLTAAGRKAFAAYLEAMTRIIDEAQGR